MNRNLIAVKLSKEQNCLEFIFKENKTLIQKATKERHSVARVFNHLNLNKRRSKINTFK